MPIKSAKKESRRTASIESRISENYDQMSEIDQRLADVILSVPGRLAMQTATELAAGAAVSKATTTRFFRKLGYATYEDARASARDNQVEGSPLYLQGRVRDHMQLNDVLGAHLEHEIANLAKTYRSLDARILSEVVQHLVSARRVVVIGYRHSHTIALMIRRELIQVRSDVVVLPAPGDTLAEYLAGLDADDVAICVGFRRRVPAFGSAMAALDRAGVPTLYLSDVLAGKPAKFARWVIRCHTDGHLLFDSMAGVASLVNLICSLVAEKLAREGNDHLQKVEILHQALQELE